MLHYIIENILYNIFALLAIWSAIRVITSTNPVKSVLFLILVYIFSSFILFLLNVEFLALLYILVYVGAIAVLFLFVVMMLNIKENTLKKKFNLNKYIYLFITFIYFLLIYYDINGINNFSNIMEFINQNNYYFDLLKYYKMSDSLAYIGSKLYTDYFLVFLMCGVLLLISMIGSITLTLIIKTDSILKTQDSFTQINKQYKQTIKKSNI